MEKIEKIDKKKEQREEQPVWSVEQVPIEFKPALVNIEEKEAYTVEQALSLILNKLDKILKNFNN